MSRIYAQMDEEEAEKETAAREAAEREKGVSAGQPTNVQCKHSPRVITPSGCPHVDCNTKMTDDKLNNLARAIAFTITVMLFVLIFIGWACGQEHAHEHKTKALEGLNNRVTVAQILWMEPIDGGWRLETKAQDKYEIRHEFFQVTPKADVDAEILAKPKGKFAFIVWCGDDRFVYLVTPVKPGNIAKR